MAAPTVVAGGGFVDRQGDVDEQFAKEEPAAGFAIEHQGVLADPAEAGLLCHGLFQHRCAVDEGSEAEGADHLLNALGQLLQALADQLVIVAAQRVAGHVGFFRVRQLLGHARVAWQVVHAQRHDSQRARHQLLRVGTFAAMSSHIVHLAVVAGFQPAFEVGLVLAQINTGDTDLLEAELAAPLLDGVGKSGWVECDAGHGFESSGIAVGERVNEAACGGDRRSAALRTTRRP